MYCVIFCCPNLDTLKCTLAWRQPPPPTPATVFTLMSSQTHPKGAFAHDVTAAMLMFIGVRARGARGAAAPPNFGEREKIWAKPVF